MGFNEEREEIEIECIDALSTLQYIKYSSDDKRVMSFAEIIRNILHRCNAYNHFYVSGNTHISDTISDAILDRLYISESNFFD